MASLQTLPTELLEYILEDLSSLDTVNLAKTCKALHAVTLPTAYHTIALEWRRSVTHGVDGDYAPKIQSLLHALVKNPAYAKLVKRLELRATGCLEYSFEDVCGLEFPDSGLVVSQREETNDLYVAWAEQLGWGNVWTDDKKLHMVMALLIGTCVQLEEVTLSVDFLMRNEWFPVMLRYGVGEGADGSRPFGKLKKVRVTTEFQDEAELWGPDFVRVQSVLLRLFFLPGVESLEIAALADLRDENGKVEWLDEDADEEFWPAWPVERRPMAQSLTTLKLVRSSVDPLTIKCFLQQTPHVRAFEFDCFMYPGHVPLDLDGLREALLYIRSTLTSLTVRYELYHNDGMNVIAQDTFSAVTGSLGPLHDFPVLSTLVVSLPVLFGTDDIDMGRQPNLSAYLPSALEYLTITDDLYRYGAFQDYFEDENAMAFFRAYLSGEKIGPEWRSSRQSYLWGEDNWYQGKCYGDIDWVQDREPEWKLKTPGLRSFTYDLEKRGEQTYGYWDRVKARKQLIRVCEGQGIIGQVLWT
jgi:hypothetical protein